jgi:hypothetical protein
LTGIKARLSQSAIASRPNQNEACIMANVLEKAVNCNDGDRAIAHIVDALGINPEDMARYDFPKTWPQDRQGRARIIGDWLQNEALFLARWAPRPEELPYLSGKRHTVLDDRYFAGE